jgi:TolA-binding protein
MRAREICLTLTLGVAGLAAGARGAPAEAGAAGGVAEASRARKVIDVAPIERRATAIAAPAAVAAGGSAGARPSVSLEAFESEHRARVKQLTDAQIEKMRALIRFTENDDPQRADLLFRAGELYAENERFYFTQARALDQKIYETPPGGARAALERQRAADERARETWLLEAVKAYVEATRFPRYERMDEVLFRLATMLTGAKKEAQAREFFHRLIKDHPTSKYIPDAYLAFGEHAFDEGRMEEARRFYDKVAEFPKSSLYPYAVYKQGWCEVNLGDYKQALQIFVGVVRIARDRGERGGKLDSAGAALEVLGREAKKDVAKAYAHVGDPDRAWPFFQRVGGSYAPKMMEALAELYWEQGEAADSTRVYKKIIADNMASPRVCEWQGKVLRNALSARDERDQAQELERLAAVVDKVPGATATEVAACRGGFHDVARELALVWHREAQKTQNADTYALAERAYRTFLAHFPDDKQAYEMTYYLGELLWVEKRWPDAAATYTQVVEMKEGGKFLRDAAYAAVLAWQNALLADDEPQRQRVESERARVANQKDFSPRPIPENQRRMIAAFHTYEAQVPDAPELPVMLYREGYICYDYNHFDCAKKQFLEVVQRHTAHPLAVFAANLFLDVLNIEGNKRELVGWTRRFLETPALVRDPDFGRQLVSLMSDAYDGEARDFERRGNAKECGRSFLAAAEALPGHAKHAERLWNAGQCFQNAHLVGQAIKAWEALRAAHPEDPLSARALYRIGAGYHQLAFYTKAAERYEEFARGFPGEERASAALGNASAFREGLGEAEAALRDMRSFVGFYETRQPREAAAVEFQMGEVYEKSGDIDRLRAHLSHYLEKWGARGGVDRQVEAHFRLGELAWKASCSHASEDGACVQITRQLSSRSRQVLEAARRRLGREKRTQCGPATKSKIVVLDRDRTQAGAAAEHFRAAIRLWKAGDATSPIAGRDVEERRAAGATAAAGAAFYLAEQSYEDLLRVKFPQNLDFSRPSASDSARHRAATARKLDDSRRRFAAYLDEKAKRLEASRAAYLEVFKLRQAPVDHRRRRAHRPAAPGLRGPALHRADPFRPAGGGRLGQPPARALLRRARGSGRQGRGQGDRGVRQLPPRRHRAVLVQRVVAAVRAGAQSDRAGPVPALGRAAPGRLVRAPHAVAGAPRGRPGHRDRSLIDRVGGARASPARAHRGGF